jgi:hypothetical protein
VYNWEECVYRRERVHGGGGDSSSAAVCTERRLTETATKAYIVIYE